MMLDASFILQFVLLLLCSFGVSVGGELPHQAYVWQRNWSPWLQSAIIENADVLSGLSVLVAELKPSADKCAVVRIPADFEVLSAAQRPITLVLRVGNYFGPFHAESVVTRTLLDEVRVALNRSSGAGLKLAAVEIDFDCATSRLEGYVEWLQQVRAVLGEVPLSITTLPTWMSRSEAFGQLVRAADSFVLQVHSVKRAASIEDTVLLCDPEDALSWVYSASEYGVPFCVALPTYGYRVTFDRTGALVDVSGEDAAVVDDPELRYRVIRAEPVAMSKLVRDLNAAQVSHCQGIIWYRLPIGGERLNWDVTTWRGVMSGLEESPGWQLEFVRQADGLIEIQMEQTAALATQPPHQVQVDWSDAVAVAWDGQRNYNVRMTSVHGLSWQWPDNMEAPLLPQGTRWTIGWCRLDTDAALTFSISP